MDPQQELFTALKQGLEEKGYRVFDGALPPKDTPYPFVYLGDFEQTDSETKGRGIGFVYPTIHVWHNNPNQRGTVSSILTVIKDLCRNTYRTSNYGWLYQRCTQQILPDNTTKQPLLHGILQPEYKFS